MLFTLTLLMLLNACNRDTAPPPVLPTEIDSPAQAGTEIFQTQNAPPVGFREPLTFSSIDANLELLPNWRYEMTMDFTGVFAGTPREAQVTTRVEVSYNQLDTSRRVIVQAEGILVGEEQQEAIQREGVRLGPDTFLVPRDNTCQTDAGEDAVTLADFRVSDLIGGVNLARSTSINGVINGEDVWRYEFTADDLNLLGVRMGSNSRIVNLSGELWVSAQHNAVIRYWLTMDVESVVVSVLSENPDSALPVTGQIIIRYDVFDIGINPNISQPFGC